MTKRVLVLAPHPDDEAIGCGGTLLRHAAEGDAIRTIFLTSGEKGCNGQPEEATAKMREAEARDAAKILGVAQTEFWRRPDGALRADSTTVARLRKAVSVWRPAILYVPHSGEQHADHVAAGRIVRRALTGHVGLALKVLTYEVWTPLQTMVHVEDITEHIEEKMQAIRAHRCQCNVMRFDDATRGLNRYRGEMHSWPGGPYAEVFGALRS